MSARSLFAPSLFALIVLVSSGCASTSTPDGWLPRAEEAAQDGYGAWIEIQAEDRSRPAVMGELIAVEDSMLTVLDLRGEVVTVPAAGIRKARVVTFQSQHKKYGGWTVLGSIASISNGFFLVFTLPTWLAVGSEAARLESASPLVDVPRQPWEALRPHARFPQGLPSGVDPARLQTRSAPRGAPVLAQDGL